MLTRRIILTGCAIAIADHVAARSMYCTRHPAACRRRREDRARQWERELARREALTPNQRRAEDLTHARSNTERENRYQAWMRREQQRFVFGGPTLKVFGGFCAAAAAFVGGIVWMARR